MFRNRYTGSQAGKVLLPLLFAICQFDCQSSGSALNIREKIFRNCMLGKNLTLDEEQNKRICNCLADKLTAPGNTGVTQVAAIDSVSKQYLDECRNQE